MRAKNMNNKSTSDDKKDNCFSQFIPLIILVTATLFLLFAYCLREWMNTSNNKIDTCTSSEVYTGYISDELQNSDNDIKLNCFSLESDSI